MPVKRERQKAKRKGQKTKVLFLFAICLLISLSVLLYATSTPYTQQFGSGHGYTYTQSTCSGGGTCGQNDANSDGNPTPSVSSYVSGKNKAVSGYWSSPAISWQTMGVPAGENVTALTAAVDTKNTYSVGACIATTAVEIHVYDSTNTIEITSAAALASTDITGSSSWPSTKTGSQVTVNAGYRASSTQVVLRLEEDAHSANSNGAVCTALADNLTLTITSEAPATRNRVIISKLEIRKSKLETGSPSESRISIFEFPVSISQFRLSDFGG
jgi:hypothetical protein